jgi:succinate dehydrogenase/fumarate reductase flavoprotein subunit
MLAPSEVPRNAEGAQRESRAKDGVPKSAARDSIKAVAPQSPGRQPRRRRRVITRFNGYYVWCTRTQEAARRGLAPCQELRPRYGGVEV